MHGTTFSRPILRLGSSKGIEYTLRTRSTRELKRLEVKRDDNLPLWLQTEGLNNGRLHYYKHFRKTVDFVIHCSTRYDYPDPKNVLSDSIPGVVLSGLSTLTEYCSGRIVKSLIGRKYRVSQYRYRSWSRTERIVPQNPVVLCPEVVFNGCGHVWTYTNGEVKVLTRVRKFWDKVSV